VRVMSREYPFSLCWDHQISIGKTGKLSWVGPGQANVMATQEGKPKKRSEFDERVAEFLGMETFCFDWLLVNGNKNPLVPNLPAEAVLEVGVGLGVGRDFRFLGELGTIRGKVGFTSGREVVIREEAMKRFIREAFERIASSVITLRAQMQELHLTYDPKNRSWDGLVKPGESITVKKAEGSATVFHDGEPKVVASMSRPVDEDSEIQNEVVGAREMRLQELLLVCSTQTDGWMGLRHPVAGEVIWIRSGTPLQRVVAVPDTWKQFVDEDTFTLQNRVLSNPPNTALYSYREADEDIDLIEEICRQFPLSNVGSLDLSAHGNNSDDDETSAEGNTPRVQDLEGLDARAPLDLGFQDLSEGADYYAWSKYRAGQAEFRAKLIARFGSCCAVTGLCHDKLVRASHIKPWKDSDSREKVDPENGLLLSGTIDLAFDAGLITFNEEGVLEVSPLLDHRTSRWLQPGHQLAKEWVTPKRLEHLAWHRALHRGNAQ
jgi:hypothetical protein